MKKVNVCGIPEKKLKNNWCNVCSPGCEMNQSLLIDERVFNYAKKKRLLLCGKFSEYSIMRYFENHPCIDQEPLYIQDYLKTLHKEEK